MIVFQLTRFRICQTETDFWIRQQPMGLGRGSLRFARQATFHNWDAQQQTPVRYWFTKMTHCRSRLAVCQLHEWSSPSLSRRHKLTVQPSMTLMFELTAPRHRLVFFMRGQPKFVKATHQLFWITRRHRAQLAAKISCRGLLTLESLLCRRPKKNYLTTLTIVSIRTLPWRQARSSLRTT